jgi:HK97 family phage major capsid protein
MTLLAHWRLNNEVLNMPLSIEELKTHLKDATDEIKTNILKRDDEVKSLGETTKATRDALTKATERMDAINADIQKHMDDYKATDARVVELEKRLQRNLDQQGEVQKSAGQQFVESDVYKRMIDQSSYRSDSMTVKSITSLAASAGALVRPDRRPDVFQNPNRPRFIRDLLPSVPTSSNAVEIMRELVFTNAAAPQGVAQATAYELVAKAQSNITYELVNIPVRTIAHWIPASRQILSDAAMLQSKIDGRLAYGLQLESDEQLLYGDGTGQNVTGLMMDAAVSNIGGMTAVGTGETLAGKMLDHIRKAITQCQKFEYYNIGGLVLSPEDMETLELAKGSDGHYIWVTVNNGGEPRFWRVPAIVTNAMNEGEFILGDWTMGATVYDRESASIRIAEQHEEYFVKNAVAILAEERYAFGIELPKAFTKGSFEISS